MCQDKRYFIFVIVVYVLFTVIFPLRHYHTNDFKHMYLAAKLVRNGIDPYNSIEFLYYSRLEGFSSINPFVYPIFNAIFFIPISYFPFEVSKYVWFFLNHIFIMVGIYFILKGVRKLKYVYICVILLFLTFSFPFYRSLTAGQLNAFLFLLYSLLFYSFVRNKMNLYAFLIAFGGMIKILPFFMGIILLRRKYWKYLLHFFLYFLLINILCIFTVGWDTYLDYIPILKAMRFGSSTWAKYGASFHIAPANQSFAAFLLRSFTRNKYNLAPILNIEESYLKIVFYLTEIFSLLVCLIFVIKLRLKSLSDYILLFLLVIYTNFFLPTIVWDHYYLITFVGYFLELLYFIKSSKKFLIIVFLFIILQFIPYNFWNSNFFCGMKIFFVSFKFYFYFANYVFIIYLCLQKLSRVNKKKVSL